MPELNFTILKNSSNLKAYYRLEGNSTDEMGVNNGSDTSMTYGTASGKFGQGASFSGSGVITIADNASLSNATASFGGWIYIPNTTGTKPVFSKYYQTDSAKSEWYMTVAGDKITLIGNGVDSISSAAGTIAANNWYHVVGIINGAASYIYINGAKVAVGTVTMGSNTTTTAKIGGLNNDATLFTGSMDDIFFYAGVLSADQIKELYEGRYIGEGWPQTGLVAGYHLSDTTDFSGNNYHLTNQGTVTFPAGKFNKAADLGASNSTKWLYITNDLGIAGGACTLSGWFKMNTEIGSSLYTILRNGDAGTNVFQNILYDYNAGTRRLWFLRGRNGTADDVGYYTITLGTTNWYHLVYTYNGANIYGYVNGNQVVGPIASSGNGASGGVDNFIIGNINASATANLPASMIADEVQIYNVAKDARWVRQQYAWGMGRLI